MQMLTCAYAWKTASLLLTSLPPKVGVPPPPRGDYGQGPVGVSATMEVVLAPKVGALCNGDLLLGFDFCGKRGKLGIKSRKISGQI